MTTELVCVVTAVLIVFFGETHSLKNCYVHLGCLETNNSWFSPNRPFNPTPSTREEINTTFQLYTRATKRDGESVFIDYELFKSRNFFKNASRNFFLIHGFRSWGKADWILDIKTELLRIFGNDANVFSVDWSGHGLDYAQTAVNARVVGMEIAKFINEQLIKLFAVSPGTIHIIGHSLGAHVAGYVGERVPGLYRITGLDPAGQHFAGMPFYIRLDPSDADFVDVMHTDTQGYGTNRPMGHIDFYANGEGDQPGCGALNMFPQFLAQGMNVTLQETGTCAHSRSHQYFIESLQAVNTSDRVLGKFIAYRCKTFQDLTEGKCINNCDPSIDDDCMYVGLEARPIRSKRNVILYFKTGNIRPYCLTPYRTYIDVLTTSVPVMHTVVSLTVYDSVGAATSWTFNDGHPMALQSRMLVSTLIFSSAVLTSLDINMVNIHWNSRFYAFGLLRKAFLNGFIRIRSIVVTTADRKTVKLCPRNGASSVEVYEYQEVMFYVNSCAKPETTTNSLSPDINPNRGPVVFVPVNSGDKDVTNPESESVIPVNTATTPMTIRISSANITNVTKV